MSLTRREQLNRPLEMLWIPHLPSAFLFLLLLPCFPGQNGGENEQSTDIINVWEGDSINITCSDSENELGMHLRASVQQVNVINVSQNNTSSIYPTWANRIKYAKEGRNHMITLYDLQESDSDIYQCSKYVLNKGSHKKLKGKTTVVVVKAKNSGVVEQSPLYANPLRGHSISITCMLRSSVEEKGIYLLKTHKEPENVLFVSSQNDSTIFPPFANRLEYSKEEKKIVITLHNLLKSDSDMYVCAGIVKNSYLPSVKGSGTMILIKDAEEEQADYSNGSWVTYGLIIVVALLFSALICYSLYRVDMKKYFQKRKLNVVYEDMSYCSRRSTLVRTNTYSTDN